MIVNLFYGGFAVRMFSVVAVRNLNNDTLINNILFLVLAAIATIKVLAQDKLSKCMVSSVGNSQRNRLSCGVTESSRAVLSMPEPPQPQSHLRINSQAHTVTAQTITMHC